MPKLSSSQVFYANKLWGHGRTLQLLHRLRCRLTGHDFKNPWDGILHCSRKCGGMRGVR